jgi:hypothetical protein
MTKKFNRNLMAAILALAWIVALSGCSVHANKSGDGGNKDVDIRSPFGSISVHEGSTEAKDTGLPAYPGARPSKGTHESDNANVNISSSMFGVKVAVQNFETDDAPDKVLSFYQKPMEKYGKVIQCSGGFGGFHSHHEKDSPVSCDDSGHDYDKELKVGTEYNQHIVAVKPRGKGSEFTLVYVRVHDDTDHNKDTI